MWGLLPCEDHIVKVEIGFEPDFNLDHTVTAAGFRLDSSRLFSMISGSAVSRSCLQSLTRGVLAAITTLPRLPTVPVKTLLGVAVLGSGAARALAALEVGARQEREHVALLLQQTYFHLTARQHDAQDLQRLDVQLAQVALAADHV
jgi:hypothetical protein